MVDIKTKLCTLFKLTAPHTFTCVDIFLVTHQSSSNEKKATGSSSLPAKPVFLNQHRKTAESEWKLQSLVTVK